jgi:cytochrome c oxidase cbb3-type subunit 2
MKSGPLLFVSAFLTLGASFWGLVLAPQIQLGGQDLRAIEPTGQLYPSGRLGLGKEGESVYRAHGCVECHTQQIRPRGWGSDIERGWGIRRTVAQDYLRDHPVQLGSLRAGPDLANIGLRQPSAEWQLKHLYHPRTLLPKSTMPPYRFLFAERKKQGLPTPDTLKLDGPWTPPEGFEIVPTDEARALVAYLLSLHADVPLFEAPLPRVETNVAPAQAASASAVPPSTQPTNTAATP